MKFYKVPGYDLKITNDGSCVIDIITNKIKTQWSDKNGYKYIMVKKDNGRDTTAKVHRLVAFTFIGPCPKGKEVNHKNLIKYDNHYKNLEYVTSKGNKLHAVKNGVRYGGSRLSWRKVKKIRKLKKNKGYSNRKLAEMNNVSKDAIRLIISNITWKKSRYLT
jgi:hypothetical protein